MIIIYHCYGGAHSSVLSAAIHLGFLSSKKTPKATEIKNIPLFDKNVSAQIGIPFYYGTDQAGNDIYIQGMGSADGIVKQLLKELMIRYNIPDESVILVDTLKNVNILIRIGGFLSRSLGFVFPGRILTIIGIKIAYKKFVRTVSTVKAKIS